jgi:hypothetical protein
VKAVAAVTPLPPELRGIAVINFANAKDGGSCGDTKKNIAPRLVSDIGH